MRYSVAFAILLAWVLSASAVGAYFLDTPHNESNGIYCSTCHGNPLFSVSEAEWAARTAANPDDTFGNAFCLICHGAAAVDDPALGSRKAPVKLVHSSATTGAAATWSTNCTQCHDVHFQGQLDWAGSAPQLFLITGTFQTSGGRTLTYTDPDPAATAVGDDYTTIGFNATITAQAGWGDVATWKAKGGRMDAGRAEDGSRGLILVPNLSTPDQTYEIIDVVNTGTVASPRYVMTVRGKMGSDAAYNGGSFGIIYGQSLKSLVMPNGGSADTDYREVKFFQPGVAPGSFGGFVDESAGNSKRVGICQVCHTSTASWRKDGSGAGHYPNNDCDSCHDILLGGGANTAPVANAGPDQSVTAGALVTLNGGSSSDADGDQLSYSWSFAAKPGASSAALSGANTAHPSFAADVVGSYVVSLVVNDGKVGSAADQVCITVNPSPLLPTITVSASPAGFISGAEPNSTRISWSTTKAQHIYLQKLNSGQPEFMVTGYYYDDDFLTSTTTYAVRAVNDAGSSPIATVTVKVLNPLTLGVAITKPLPGETILQPFTAVEGLVTNGGAEVGVTVNGIPAQMMGNTFFVDNLPLSEGANTITAVATAAGGTTDQSSVTVTSNTNGQEWLELSLNPESGIADPGVIPPKPFAATLKVTPHLSNSLTSWSWGYQYSYTGYGTNPDPVTLDSYSGEGFELQLSFSDPGVYRFTYILTDTGVANGQTYTQEIMVNVRSAGEFDAFLKDKWNGAKSALANHDIEGGLANFLDSTKNRYRVALNAINADSPTHLPSMFNNVPDIQQVYVWGNRVKYRVNRVHDINGTAVTVTYYIYFVKDVDGIWRIEQF